MLPNLFYSLSLLFYFVFYLERPIGSYFDLETYEDKWYSSLATILFIYLFLLFIRDIEQRFDNIEAKVDIFNTFDTFQFALSFAILLEHTTGFLPITINNLRIIAAFDSLLLCFKVGEMLRILSRTFSFYLRLIFETLYDVAFFFVIFFAFLMTFATATFIQDMSQYERGLSELEIYTENKVNVRWFTNIIHQYLMALGEFDLEHLQESEDKPWPIFMFIITTFIIQVVILNMLIAIMGDTFDKVQD